MFFLIAFIVIPLTLFWVGLYMFACAMQTSMTVSSVLLYSLGGVICFLLLVGYIYFLWRLGRDDRERKRKHDLTETILSYRANSGEFDYIYVDLNTCRAYCCRPDGSNSPFSFSEYGYREVNSSSILGILRNLEYKLDGFLVVQSKEFAVYDPSIKITHGTMPGGGDGYYVDMGGYETGNMPTCAYLYLGETARQKRAAAKRSRR